jgi:hypothetical protein
MHGDGLRGTEERPISHWTGREIADEVWSLLIVHLVDTGKEDHFPYTHASLPKPVPWNRRK